MSEPTPLTSLYLVAIVTFILGAASSSPPRARARLRQPARRGRDGDRAIARHAGRATGSTGYGLIVVGDRDRRRVGMVGARRVKMTAMPQMVALFNGVGGGAAALVALRGVPRRRSRAGRIGSDDVGRDRSLSALIGAVSFAGSLIAFAKLQELISGRPIDFPARRSSTRSCSLLVVVLGVAIVAGAAGAWLLALVLVRALLFGVLFVLPIGGADMPVVISLLNSFTGLAAAATGFVLHSNVADRQRDARRRLRNAADDDRWARR